MSWLERASFQEAGSFRDDIQPSEDGNSVSGLAGQLTLGKHFEFIEFQKLTIG
jgi:hypothetical protein